ncbi:MAG: TrpB-like pyridoxal-phosphate dependent enzyme, partial [Oscillospiraceae bacterium]
MDIPHKIILPEDRIPRQWYNLRADMPQKPPPLVNPGTGKPATLEELTPVFCDELAKQELD